MSFHLSLLAFYHKNKIFEHRVLGKVSCEAYLSNFTECAERNGTQKRSYCDDLYRLTEKCLRAQTVDEVRKYIDEQLQERRRLLNFLHERDSQIPERLKQHNTWNIFHAASEEQLNPSNQVPASVLNSNLKFIRQNDG